MVQDSRLLGKPETNDGSLPVMVYDHAELPQTSENIWHAQKAGWPVILTYDGRAALADGGEDTVENAGSTWVGHCDAGEQRKQARLIADFYRRHGALTHQSKHGRPFWFEVQVVNMPQARKPG